MQPYKEMKKSLGSVPPKVLNPRHSKTNSFQEMTDDWALTMKTFTQTRMLVHVIIACVQIEYTENELQLLSILMSRALKVTFNKPYKEVMSQTQK